MRGAPKADGTNPGLPGVPSPKRYWYEKPTGEVGVTFNRTCEDCQDFPEMEQNDRYEMP